MKSLPVLILLLLLCFAQQARAVNIYVSPNGSDTNIGTKEQPLATLAAALRKARELRRLHDPAIEKGITINLMSGIYNVYETVYLYPEDAGTAESPLLITTDEKAILSGGVSITNWKKITTPVKGLQAKAQQQVWVADVPQVQGNQFSFRQLWVNEIKATRAKSCNGDTMARILSWNKATASCWVPVPHGQQWKNLKSAEMFIHQWWAIANLRIKTIQQQGDSAELFFHEPESKIQNEHPWPAPWLSKETGNSAFYISNDISFLDEPGEWWLDEQQQKIYYWPRQGEDLRKSAVVAPYTETLVKIEGTIDRPVSYVYFQNISFAYTSWLRPSQKGHVPHQAGMYMLDAYKLKPAGTTEKKNLDNQAWIGRPAAAVQVSYAMQTVFENCRFTQLASTGLDYHRGVQQNKIIGNLFKDIGGTAILAGVFAEEAQEIHLTYTVKDEREICDGLSITNNLVTNATNEDWSAVGIGLGYTRNSLVVHNEIHNVSYSGISMGWGWNPAPNVMKNNVIKANKIQYYGMHNYDCAGIYTLSAQPGSVIEENYIDSIYKAPYAHIPGHWFYLYTDEGSSYITVKNNWTPTTKFLQNNNGPGNIWDNNGPQENMGIKSKAGLEPAYNFWVKEKTPANKNRFINRQHNELIELVVPADKKIDLTVLRALLAANELESNTLYQWNNRYVIFGNIKDLMVLEGKLKNNFPEINIRPYHNLFYRYDKDTYCADKTTATEWDHFIITTNLVNDTRKQKEYIDAHNTQFEKWPEVAKGFCNAGFQQLLLFKNGRQLMLVISVPKGKTLAELDPKTVENNPRVNDWNKLMGQYQEGIEGTKKGEVWLELRKLK